MKNINVQHCPACGSSKCEKILTTLDYLISKESFDIINCSNCSLRFTSPIPNEEDSSIYYRSDDYISHTVKSNSVINIIYKFVQHFTLRSKRKIVRRITQKKVGTLLDIGCGAGNFLRIMLQSGWAVTGVEINKEARALAKINTESVIMDQTEYFESEQKYDVITLWHSLEHLHELEKYLNKICISLNTDGVVIIAVPNYKSFDAEYYQHEWAAYDVPRHLYHFSFEAMVKLMKKFNFELLRSKQLPFDPYYVSLLSETKVRKKKNIVRALLVGWKSYWQGHKNKERGSSILYIFKFEGNE
ncbi:MAG: class I SAM-dependent methyltransferase [Candidatus Neomarinimicrobiota bacterium]